MAPQTDPEAAMDLLHDARFNRTFEYIPPGTPETPGAPSRPLTVTYADYGYRNEAHPEQERVLLFSPPLMGSRLLLMTKHALAVKHKIRIISADRPGFGSTDAAPPKDRLGLWREIIPALLTHLHIPHLHALLAHSGGTVYALDLLLHHPTLLSPDPARPTYLALGAPWILPSHTSSVPLSLLKMLPAGLISQTDKLGRLVHDHVAPAVGGSAGFLGRVGGSGWLTTASSASSSSRGQGQGEAAVAAAGGEEEEDQGVAEEERLWKGVMRRVYEEGMAGMSDDALLLLQKGAGVDAGWGDWGDYDGLVPRLGEVLRDVGRRLRVGVFYAEKDLLIGDGGTASKGAKWFDACWEGGVGDVIEYGSRTIEGADHDGVWGLKWGAAQEVFETVGEGDRA